MQDPDTAARLNTAQRLIPRRPLIPLIPTITVTVRPTTTARLSRYGSEVPGITGADTITAVLDTIAAASFIAEVGGSNSQRSTLGLRIPKFEMTNLQEPDRLALAVTFSRRLQESQQVCRSIWRSS